MATVTYSYAQTRHNWSGALDDISSAVSLKTRARRSFFYSKIIGTTARARLYQNGTSQNSGMIQVSVDGGNWVAAGDAVGGYYTLFAGLADTAHEVFVRWHPAYGNSGTVPKTGADWLEVDGASPSALLMQAAVSIDDNVVVSTGLTEANSVGFLPDRRATSTNYPTRTAFTTSATHFAVTKAGTSKRPIHVSVDGGPTLIYSGSAGDNDTTVGVFTGDGLEHRYNIWSHDSILSVCCDAPITRHGARLNQFGDSITFGGGSTYERGDTDVSSTAAYFGMTGGTYGISGWTINDVFVNLTDMLTNSRIEAGDVAVLAIGRNNMGTLLSDPTSQSQYGQIIQQMLSAGYSKVLCRAVLPEIADDFATQNAVLESIVSGLADPRAIWISTAAWLPIDRPDGTHPNTGGYQQITEFSKVDYAPYLAAPVESPVENSTLANVVTDVNVAISTIDVSSGITDGTATALTYSIVGDNLPTGLTLTGSNITGTPTVDGVTNVTVRVENELGGFINRAPFSITVNAAPPAPTISGVSGANASSTVTITVDAYDTVSSVTYGGVSLSNVVEATPTTITATMPKGGFAFGSSNDFVVTDANGSSNAFSANFAVRSGWAYVILTQAVDWMPNSASGDQLTYETTTSTGGEYSVSVAADGTITWGVGAPDNAGFLAYLLDQSSGYAAGSDVRVYNGYEPDNTEFPALSMPVGVCISRPIGMSINR